MLDEDEMKLADVINDFRYKTKPTDMSPPNMTTEQLTVRNLAIIDMANAIAREWVGNNEKAFLERALTRRTS